MAVTNFDKRYNRRNPVAVRKLSMTLDYSEDNQNISENIKLNGTPDMIVFGVPDLENTNSATLIFLNADSVELYNSGEKAEDTTHKITSGVDVPLCGTITVKITTSGAQTADRDFTVTIYYK